MAVEEEVRQREPIWQETQDAARLANDRCAFTAFNGYEWTKVQPDAAVDQGGANLHHNVIFRGESIPASPITVFEAPNSEMLWARLQRDCRDAGTGCDAITIPHNTNQSSGVAFKPIATEPVPEFPFFADRPLTAEDAKVRASFESVVEIMQAKGASECRISMLSDGGVPYLGSDELCDFESQNSSNQQSVPVPNKPQPRLSLVREGLKEGQIEHVMNESLLRFVESSLYLVALGPRFSAYDVLVDTKFNRDLAKALADAADFCWDASLGQDIVNFGRSMRESFAAQVAMFPHMLNDRITDLIDEYRHHALGWKLSGAGGGGYLILVADNPIPDTVRVLARRETE